MESKGRMLRYQKTISIPSLLYSVCHTVYFSVLFMGPAISCKASVMFTSVIQMSILRFSQHNPKTNAAI